MVLIATIIVIEIVAKSMLWIWKLTGSILEFTAPAFQPQSGIGPVHVWILCVFL
jgi:hypothetical protein